MRLFKNTILLIEMMREKSFTVCVYSVLYSANV